MCMDELDVFSSKKADNLLGVKISSDIRIKELIGFGGMGKVYLGEQFHAGLTQTKKVAIKTINVDSILGFEYAERIYREIAAMAELEHKNILPILQTPLREDGVPYIVMEYCDKSLRDYIDAKKYPESELDFLNYADIFIQTLYGLSYAHKKGFLHRDINPSNIFIKEDKDKVEIGSPNLERRVLLGDFSLVKIDPKKEEKLLRKKGFQTTMDKTLGTPYYRSPEQTRIGEKADKRTDLWQMGVVMYECLTGILPFESDNYEQLYSKIRNKKPITPKYYNKKIPKSLEVITLRLLEKNPKNRYDSADKVIRDLSAFKEGISLFRVDPKYSYYNLRQFANKPFRYKIAFAFLGAVLISPSAYVLNFNNFGLMPTKSINDLNVKTNYSEILAFMPADVDNNLYLKNQSSEDLENKALLCKRAKILQTEFDNNINSSFQNIDDEGVFDNSYVSNSRTININKSYDVYSVLIKYKTKYLSSAKKLDEFFKCIDEVKIFPYFKSSFVDNKSIELITSHYDLIISGKSVNELSGHEKIFPKTVNNNIKEGVWVDGNSYNSKFCLDYLLNRIRANSDMESVLLFEALAKVVATNAETLGLRPSRLNSVMDFFNENNNLEKSELLDKDTKKLLYESLQFNAAEYVKRYYENNLGMVPLLNEFDRKSRNFGQDIIYTLPMLSEILPLVYFLNKDFNIVESMVTKYLYFAVDSEGSASRFTYKELDKKFVREHDDKEFKIINHVNMMNGLVTVYDLFQEEYIFLNNESVLEKSIIILDKAIKINDYYINNFGFYEDDLNSTALAAKAMSKLALILKGGSLSQKTLFDKKSKTHNKNELLAKYFEENTDKADKYFNTAINYLTKLFSSKYSNTDLNYVIFSRNSNEAHKGTSIETITYCQDAIKYLKDYENYESN